MKKESIPVRNSLLLLLTATIWGVAFVAQSVSMDYIGGFTFNAVRNLIGALTLLPVIWGLGKTKAPEEKKRIQASSDRKTLITGGICCGILRIVRAVCILFLCISSRFLGNHFQIITLNISIFSFVFNLAPAVFLLL